ncbi:CDP-glycerol glycerophosphotransferase family protein [Chloroflexota bacterium]
MDSGFLTIIEEPRQIDGLISLAASKRKRNIKPRVIALHKDVQKELARRGLESKTLQDYGLSEGDLEEEGLKWFRAFPNIKIKDNKNIKELITYDGISVWWLVDELFYLSPYVFHKVREIVKQVIILDHITKVEGPSMVCYAQNDTPISRAIEFICKSKNIATVKAFPSSSIKRLLSQKLKVMVYTYGPWLQMLVRKACLTILGRGSRQRMISEKKRFLAFSGDNWVDVYDLATGQTRKGDPYYDSLVNLLKDDYGIVSVVRPTKGWGIKTMKEKAQQQRVMYRPFGHYLNRKIILKALKASKELHRNYQSLAECESFRQSLNLHDMPIYDLVEQKLSLLFSRGYLTMVVTVVEMAKCMIETEKPDVILMSDSPIPERAIIATAKLKGIPTVAAMHGAHMIPYIPCLNHAPEDIGPNKEATAPYCPVTDKFAAYGEDDKDIIVKRGRFPEEDVLIGGQPRYDILARADELFNREGIFKKLNLNPSKKLVTWMTQSHSYTAEENKRNITAVYDAIKPFRNVQLVVKLHPGEGQRAALYREDKTLKPTILGGFGAITFELLYISDIVITHYCTTAIEALMLNKPVIVIDFSGTPISVPYTESGAAIGVYEENVLASTLKEILYNEEARQRLAEAREKFISENNYKPDGLASQRVANLIKQVVAESNKTLEKIYIGSE